MCSQRTGTVLAVVLSTIALVLFVVNAWTVNGSQALQKQASDRQQQINSGMQISQLNTQLVRALGAAVIDKNDTKIKDMLGAQGITVKADAAATPAKGKAAAPVAPAAPAQ